MSCSTRARNLLKPHAPPPSGLPVVRSSALRQGTRHERPIDTQGDRSAACSWAAVGSAPVTSRVLRVIRAHQQQLQEGWATLCCAPCPRHSAMSSQGAPPARAELAFKSGAYVRARRRRPHVEGAQGTLRLRTNDSLHLQTRGSVWQRPLTAPCAERGPRCRERVYYKPLARRPRPDPPAQQREAARPFLGSAAFRAARPALRCALRPPARPLPASIRNAWRDYAELRRGDVSLCAYPSPPRRSPPASGHLN